MNKPNYQRPDPEANLKNESDQHGKLSVAERNLSRSISASDMCAAGAGTGLVIAGIAIPYAITEYVIHDIPEFLILIVLCIASALLGILGIVKQRQLDRAIAIAGSRSGEIAKVSDGYVHRIDALPKPVPELQKIQTLLDSGIALLETNEEIEAAFARIQKHGRNRLPDLSSKTNDIKSYLQTWALSGAEPEDAIEVYTFLRANFPKLALPPYVRHEPPETGKDGTHPWPNDCEYRNG